MKYLVKTLMAVLIFSVTASAQSNKKPAHVSPKQSLKMADYLYGLGSYFNAINYYQNVYENENKNAYVIDRIASAEYYLRDYKEAEKWYKTLLDVKSDAYPLAGYYYALMMKYNGKYVDAKNAFMAFEKSIKGPLASIYKKMAKNQQAGCDLAIDLIAHPDKVKIQHLDSKVNAPYTELSPTPAGDDLLLYASLKSDTIIILDDMKKNQSFTQFYAAKKVNDSVFEKGQIYKDMPINADDVHNGNGTFSPDKQRFYFTRCKTDANMKIRCDIYITELGKTGKWSNPVKLPKEVNDPDSTNTQPTVGTSKQGEVLYFTSNRPQGMGGTDIWYCTRNKDGSFSMATNLGKKINSSGNEITPYYDVKNSVLYFSSDGQVGIGGYDIFSAKGGLKKWEVAKNIGYPVNSSCDDMYYVLDDNKYSGYFVSNRPGTISVKSETCCDDIYRFEYPRIYYSAVRGFVYDVDTKIKIDSAKVIMVTRDTMWGTPQLSSSAQMYFWDTKAPHDYELKGEKAGYFSNAASFSVVKHEYNDTLQVDLFLKKIPEAAPIVIKNIYYDFDKATLRDSSKASLDSLYQLLVDNPSLKIEIRSHTDSKGNDDYNQKLSQARAQSVVDYLKGRGIEGDRLVATGMGETDPIAPNEIKGKDNPEGRQLNRRTDFKVIGTIPGKEIIYKQGNEEFDENATDTLEKQKEEEK